jgi:hypothetical protein
MTDKISVYDTLMKNSGRILTFVFQIIIFNIGLKVIWIQKDQFIVLFCTLIWAFVFLKSIRFRIKLVYKNKKGVITHVVDEGY